MRKNSVERGTNLRFLDLLETAHSHIILVAEEGSSFQGQDYLNGMAAAANFAWVNRSSMTFLARQAFSKMFNMAPDDLDMHVVYDVSHNIAKVEKI